MKPLAFHPLANVFPLLEGEEFHALVADIQASGLCEAVWLYEGQILDGRNRYRACQKLGQDCATRPYTGEDPLGFVLSMNLQRRHLDESQRAMIAARLATMRQGERTDLVESSTKFSQEQAAGLVHVSRETVVAAKKVLQDGAPELAQDVEAGMLAVSAAVPLTALPRDIQPAALAEVLGDAAGKKPTAKQTCTAVRRRQGGTTVTAERDGHPQAAEAIQAALPTCLVQLFDSVEALATLPDLAQLLLDIAPDWYDRLDQYLDRGFATFNDLRSLWKQQRRKASDSLKGTHEKTNLVPEVSTEPQQPSPPAQAPRRGETGPAQPRAETEDAAPQTAKTGADYDTTRFYLGKPCPRAHTYRDTGQTLRRQRKGDCVQCHRES